MRCHYINDKEAGRVLIPGCWPVVASNDINRCCCKKWGGNRHGAGAKKKKKSEKVEPTKVMRIPLSKVAAVLKAIGKA